MGDQRAFDEIEISSRRVPSYAGIRLVSDPHLVDVIEDWSVVRSPSRAAKRRRQGHPQRIRYREIPKPEFYHLLGKNMIVAHPATIGRIHARLADDMKRRREAQAIDAVQSPMQPGPMEP